MQSGHLAADGRTTAGGSARIQRELSEETQRSPAAAGTSRAAVSGHQEDDGLRDHNRAGADRSASPGLRPVTREPTPGGRVPVRESERRPAARSDGRLGGGPTTALRQRHGADIRRQFLGPRESSVSVIKMPLMLSFIERFCATYRFDAATATGAPLVANRRTISYGRPPAVAHGPSVTLF